MARNPRRAGLRNQMKNIVFAVGLLAALGGGLTPVRAQNPTAKPAIGAWGFDLTGMDREREAGRRLL